MGVAQERKGDGMKPIKWREDGKRCTKDDNRRRWIPGQFWAGDQIDMIHDVTSEVLDSDWQAARQAQLVADYFLIQMITSR